MGVIRRLTAIVANLSLLLNSFLPFLLIAKPTYAQSPEIVVSKIVYDTSANKLDITTNSTEKVAYQLFYKTPEKIDAIAGNDLNQSNQNDSFYLGTCSANSVCLSQKISRGILKVELDSKFISKLFIFENNVLTVVKEIESTQTDLTEEENNFLENGDLTNSTLWTFKKVELNKEYVAPQNSGVKITFTKLPETSGNIKIEEINLTPEQIEQTGSLSDKAYDITSDMVDGTFAYNLSLPIPESSINETVEIKYAEDISEIELAQKVDETITNTDTSVSVKNLDHFTVFVVTSPPYNGNITGFVGATGLTVLGNTAGDFNTTISGVLTEYSNPGQRVSFSGTISGNIVGNIRGGVNYNGADTLFAEITGSGASGYVYLIGIFSGEDGHFVGKFVNQPNPINFTTEITINGGNTVSVGDTLQLSATTNGDSQEVAWAVYVNDSSKASINQTTGLLTAINVGIVTVIASALDGSLVTKNHTVTITPDVTAPPIPTGLKFQSTDRTKDFICRSFLQLQPVTPDWDDITNDSTFSHYEYTSFLPNGTIGLNEKVLKSSEFPNTWMPPADGAYGYAVRSVDFAGNKSDWSLSSKTLAGSCQIIYDNTAPSKPIFTSPTINITNINAITLKWDGGDDTGSGVKGYIFRYVFNPANGGNLVNWSSGFVNSTTKTRSGSFGHGQGTYMMYIKTIDNIGNESLESDALTITYDATAPTATVNYSTTNWTNGDVTATIVPSESVTVTNNSGSSQYIFSDNGSFTFEFKDLAGNAGSVTATVNNIDKIAPILTSKTTFSGWYKTNKTSIFSYTDSLSGIASGNSVSCVINTQGANQTCLVTPNICDNVGNCNTTPMTSNGANIDKIKPSTPVVTQPSANGYITSPTTQTFVWSESVDSTPGSGLANSNTYQYQIDNDSGFGSPEKDWSVTTTTWTLTNPLPDGTYYIRVRAKDAAGNKSLWSASVKFYVDTLSPNAEITAPQNNDIISGTYNIAATATDDVSGIEKVEFYHESLPTLICSDDDPSNGFSCDWDSTLIIDGLHQLYVIAYDKAGNSVESVRLNITVDNTPPTSTIDGGEDNGVVYSNTWDGSITGTATDNLSGVKEVQLTIQNSTNEYWTGLDWQTGETSVIAAGTTNWTYQIGTTLNEGTYTIKSHAVDNANNMENTYTLTIVLDKTISEVGISLNPADPDAANGWYKTQPEITLTHTDTNFDKIEYQWDSQSNTGWNIYSNPFTLANEGAHILYYRAVDKANNISPVGRKNIKWDKTDLELGPQNISANPNPTSGSTSKITWEAAKDNDGIDKYEVHWTLNDSSESKSYSKTVGSNTFEVEIDQLIEGRWTVRVIAFDASGKSRDNSIDLIVDRTGPSAPNLSLTGTGTGTASLSWNAINDAKDYIIWYGNTPGTYLYGARVGNVTSYTVQGLGAGNYYFVIKSVDEAQNQSGYSNEVNTGNITGAIGTIPGQPAEGFTEDVLGDDTENETTSPTPTLSSGGEVLGESGNNLFNWRWLLLLLLIPTYLIGRRYYKEE